MSDQPPGPLEGEDISTTHWEDARHWIGVYADLLRFKVGLLERIRRDLSKLPPIAQRAAAADLTIIEAQMEGYQQRLAAWYKRVWELQGLYLDPEGRVIRYQDREAALTRREFQLLHFLIDHPHRYFKVGEISGRAWGEPSLFPEEVRNYVRRIRKILIEMNVPVDLVNRPGKGYTIEVRADR